ncbi:MAG: Flagellar hook protein FlgE [Candidatus Ozemobacter sibiricus]|uniref:Flagellar hook protein FlgE n=1 Tax=Candidatus Ozemobacter sibiricus TaxID=2268124 RepID=A0A367ZAW8_9BACT|nr:MAG: Flagellar hook protein FlgE [Candidatus Ozemobacter sibiricus]
MLRSLFTGVSGLKQHQTRMDVLSNNIANVNTTGFKRGRALFQDLFSETLRHAQQAFGDYGGLNPMQVGLGVKLAAIDTLMEQGTLETTGKNTDLAIEGEGFFTVQAPNGNTYYTRDGNFNINPNYDLVSTNTGFKIMGWLATQNPVTGNLELNQTGTIPETINIVKYLKKHAHQTNLVTYASNLDSGSEERDVKMGTDYLAFLDTVGKDQKLQFKFKKIDSKNWLWSAIDSNNKNVANGSFRTDDDGNLIETSVNPAGPNSTAAAPYFIYDPDGVFRPAEATIPMNDPANTGNGASTPVVASGPLIKDEKVNIIFDGGDPSRATTFRVVGENRGFIGGGVLGGTQAKIEGTPFKFETGWTPGKAVTFTVTEVQNLVTQPLSTREKWATITFNAGSTYSIADIKNIVNTALKNGGVEASLQYDSTTKKFSLVGNNVGSNRTLMLDNISGPLAELGIDPGNKAGTAFLSNYNVSYPATADGTKTILNTVMFQIADNKGATANVRFNPGTYTRAQIQSTIENALSSNGINAQVAFITEGNVVRLQISPNAGTTLQLTDVQGLLSELGINPITQGQNTHISELDLGGFVSGVTSKKDFNPGVAVGFLLGGKVADPNSIPVPAPGQILRITDASVPATTDILLPAGTTSLTAIADAINLGIGAVQATASVVGGNRLQIIHNSGTSESLSIDFLQNTGAPNYPAGPDFLGREPLIRISNEVRMLIEDPYKNLNDAGSPGYWLGSAVDPADIDLASAPTEVITLADSAGHVRTITLPQSDNLTLADIHAAIVAGLGDVEATVTYDSLTNRIRIAPSGNGSISISGGSFLGIEPAVQGLTIPVGNYTREEIRSQIQNYLISQGISAQAIYVDTDADGVGNQLQINGLVGERIRVTDLTMTPANPADPADRNTLTSELGITPSNQWIPDAPISFRIYRPDWDQTIVIKIPSTDADAFQPPFNLDTLALEIQRQIDKVELNTGAKGLVVETIDSNNDGVKDRFQIRSTNTPERIRLENGDGADPLSGHNISLLGLKSGIHTSGTGGAPPQTFSLPSLRDYSVEPFYLNRTVSFIISDSQGRSTEVILPQIDSTSTPIQYTRSAILSAINAQLLKDKVNATASIIDTNNDGTPDTLTITGSQTGAGQSITLSGDETMQELGLRAGTYGGTAAVGTFEQGGLKFTLTEGTRPWRPNEFLQFSTKAEQGASESVKIEVPAPGQDGLVFKTVVNGETYKATGTISKGAIHTTSITIFDSLGAPHELVTTWEHIDKKTQAWRYTITYDKNDPEIQRWLRDPAHGVPDPDNPTEEWLKKANHYDPVTNKEGLIKNSTGIIYFTNNGKIDLARSTIKDIMLTPAGSNPLTIKLDQSLVTQFDSPFTTKAREQNGYEMGLLETIYFEQDGTIRGVYSNGQKQPIGQVALTTFNNPAGLEKKGKNLYEFSPNSGQPIVGKPGQGDHGLIVPGTLEMSNVDIAEEFTNMIITQRAFQANSRVITTSDEILQEVVNLKR